MVEGLQRVRIVVPKHVAVLLDRVSTVRSGQAMEEMGQRRKGLRKDSIATNIYPGEILGGVTIYLYVWVLLAELSVAIPFMWKLYFNIVWRIAVIWYLELCILCAHLIIITALRWDRNWINPTCTQYICICLPWLSRSPQKCIAACISVSDGLHGILLNKI